MVVGGMEVGVVVCGLTVLSVCLCCVALLVPLSHGCLRIWSRLGRS